MSGIKRTREPQQSFNESFGNSNCILNICTALPDIEPESKKGHLMVHIHYQFCMVGWLVFTGTGH